MLRFGPLAALFMLLAAPAGPAHAADGDGVCPYPKGRKIADLAGALAAHKEWLDKRGWENPDIPGRADFCNADLAGESLQEALLSLANLKGADLGLANLRGVYLANANLEGANLTQTDLQGANLVNANLQGAALLQTNLQAAKLIRANLKWAKLFRANLNAVELGEANLQGADLRGANLQRTDLGKANLKDATLSGSSLEGARLTGANLKGNDLTWANLQEADLRRANLQEANLFNSNLKQVDLSQANLQMAYLVETKLQGADLSKANLKEADLSQANLQEANLNGTNLQGADLSFAFLHSARIRQTVLSNAKLSYADLSGALYQPATAPASGSLAGLAGLESVWFCPGEASGIVQLREALKQAGLREPERVATNRLESLRTEYKLARWNGFEFKDKACPALERNRMAAVEGAFRLVFFEWTTGYGLAYGRPLLILLGLIGVFALVYAPALLTVPKNVDGGGIFRIWPTGRIRRSGARLAAADDTVIERLRPRLPFVPLWAFYFSVISAFHLGWRDLNVGTWIARMQPREYALRARGWVRAVSGLQSLISVYLLALWVLSYFGRPFG